VNWTLVYSLLLFLVVSAVGTTVLLRRRGIPIMKLGEAENFDWRVARRVIGSFVMFVALAQAIALTPLVKGAFQLWGAPVFLWAMALLYLYVWVRCIALLKRKTEE